MCFPLLLPNNNSSDHTRMPAKFDGLLENCQLEEVSLQSTNWKPLRSARWSFDCIRPEFMSLRPGSPTKKPTRPTAWLDGLRGFAAFLVYIHHNQLWAHGGKGNLVYENAFGYEGRHYFAALPFVRLFFSGGHFAVSIFFVISGYVLSLKSLSLIQKGHTQAAAEGITSALFRRWLRLYIPIIVVTFLWMCLRHGTKLWVDMHEMKPTFSEDVLHWYYMFKNYSFVFSTNIYEFTLPYHPHAWSIPIEFKGSIIIYTALSAFSRCTKNARLWCEMGLIFYFMYIVDGYYGAMFMAGMLLCDLELLAQDDQLPQFLSSLASFKEFIFFHLFIVALYLGGVPSYDAPDVDKKTHLYKSPGWKWLSWFRPQAPFDAKWFYLFWAAFLAVASIPRLPWLKRFFESRSCQYLARISFALYLVHGPVIYALCDRLYAAVGLSRPEHKEGIPGWVDKFPLSTKGPLGLELAFWAPQVIILPVTLYLAEVVTKAIDEPSVKFANWFYRKTLSPPQSPKR
ncbi:acyltransferase-like protein [Pyrenochaeta sp. MPI-SDFR-AT-0127]|nr:acyltransferase-like protein [Pyrenochaeta sp. MPI-SDFR-AT-0127]